MEQIAYQDFEKLDIRTGIVLDASAVEGADRLIQIRVDTGESNPRTVVAGMKQYYLPEEMIGKTIIVLVNLEPRKMRGILSDGMLLAASTPDFGTVKLLTVDGDMPPGSKIS
ncbi:methionine--tRNA ligase subunit beta [bacterium]|nr:methionine--tRNA ligase subunit beta [candidate division CSSED10-310 bacterium]